MPKTVSHALKTRIGNQLRTLIERDNITQDILAADTQVGINTINRIVNGVNAPGHDLIVKFADYFKVSVDEIYGRKKEGE